MFSAKNILSVNATLCGRLFVGIIPDLKLSSRFSFSGEQGYFPNVAYLVNSLVAVVNVNLKAILLV